LRAGLFCGELAELLHHHQVIDELCVSEVEKLKPAFAFWPFDVVDVTFKDERLPRVSEATRPHRALLHHQRKHGRESATLIHRALKRLVIEPRDRAPVFGVDQSWSGIGGGNSTTPVARSRSMNILRVAPAGPLR
jgi:hypothetical protein